MKPCRHSVEKLTELYNSGMTCRQTAKHLGDINHRTVAYHINNAVLDGRAAKRSLSESLIIGAFRKYKMNNNFFKVIDTEQKAYVLGFFYADGYNNQNDGAKIEINLAAIDEEILHKISACLECNVPLLRIEAYKKDGYTRQDKICIRFRNRVMSDDLAALGAHQAKSLDCVFPNLNQVPEHLLNHFIRGYFDGDGWVTYNKKRNDINIGFCGSHSFIETLNEILNNKFHSTVRTYKQDKISRVAYAGSNITKNIHEWMYEDATIFLERKMNSYTEYLKIFKSKKKFYPKITKCDLSGNVLQEYESTIEAEQKNPGTNRANIWKCCAGKYAHSNGFRWVFSENLRDFETV